MKKYIFIISLFIAANAVAQNETDALRYSQNYTGGTARSAAMGGAFSALGGDASTLSTNPAGIGVYRRSELTFTPTLNYNKSESDYLGSSYSDFKYNFNLNNFGFILSATDNDRDSGWVSVNLGFAVNKLNNFNQTFMVEGVNSNSSLADLFASHATGTSYDQLSSFSDGLAFDTYVIDTLPGTTDQYYLDLPSYGQTQRRIINTTGAINEMAFSLGANYSHKLYLGATLGIQKVRYIRNSEYTEEDKDGTFYFQDFSFNETLKSYGTGYNFKVGAIYRPMDWLRAGLALHTPTFFVFEDVYYSDMSSNFPDNSSYSSESGEGTFSYEVQTPFKAIGSLGFMVEKSILIGLDAEYIDYSIARLRSSDYNFRTENGQIQSIYTQTANVKAGFEYRYGVYRFRAGAAYYGSPYTKSHYNSNAIGTSYSVGFGIKDEEFFFDVAYTLMENKYQEYMYNSTFTTYNEDYDNFVADKYKINSRSSNIMATIGFKF